MGGRNKKMPVDKIPITVWEQIPVVVIFATFCYLLTKLLVNAFKEITREFKAVTSTMAEAVRSNGKDNRDALDSLIKELRCLTDNFISHDTYVREVVARRPNARKTSKKLEDVSHPSKEGNEQVKSGEGD